MKSGYTSKLIKSIPVLALIILSIIPATALIIPHVKAEGTIELSSSTFHPWKVVEIKVSIPGLDAPYIELRVLDPAGQPLPITLYACKAAVGVFYAYLGGENAVAPKYPKAKCSNYFANIPSGYGPGTTFTIEVLGYGITATLTYTTVKPAYVKLDRTEVPARRTSEYTVVITIKDDDLNLDPTAVDDLSQYPVKIDVTWISGTTGDTKTTTVVRSGASIRESAVNSGEFSIEVTVDDLTPSGAQLSKGDIFLLAVYSDIGWGGDSAKKATARLDVVYRYPEVSVDFTQQGVTISIKSPDDNVKTGTKDTLDPSKSVTIEFAGKTCTIGGSQFKETGANTAVFTYTLPVSWGSSSDLITTATGCAVVLGLDTESFKLSATYLYITGSGTYVTAKPEVEVVKQSPVSVILLVKDRDINVDSNSIDRLTPAVDATNDVILLQMGTLTIYEIRVYDAEGNLVDIPGDYPATSVTFFETDFDSGIFRLTLPSRSPTKAVFEAGKSYTIRIKDHTGKEYTVDVPVNITPVEIKLDRSEYPATPGSLTIYITYSNDIYNAPPNGDPTTIDKIQNVVKVDIIGNDGSTLASYTVPALTETGVDTGVFKGSIVVTIPNTDAVVEGKIVVYDPNYPAAKAEAKLKIYEGSLKAEPAEVRMGDKITITLEDQDLNRDSGAAESFTITLTSDRCGSMSVTLKETGPNTGVFTATITVGREYMFSTCLKAPDTFTIKYSDMRARSYITRAGTTAYERYTVTLPAKVALKSTTAKLDVVTAEEGYIGIVEKFKIVVSDPDENLYLKSKDSVNVYVVIETDTGTIEGSLKNPLTETDVSTGVFVRALTLSDILNELGAPAAGVKDLAKFVGKRILIMYEDEADESGVVSVLQKILTFKAYEPYLAVSPKDFVNVGEEIEVNVTDKNVAGAGYVKISVTSTTFPMPIEITAKEIVIDNKPTGVFTARIKVVDPAEWNRNLPQVPAKLGDTITIKYVAPVNSAGQTDVPLTTSLVVGRYAPIPAKTEKVETVDEYGKPVTPSVGKLTFVSVTVKNVDIVPRDMTVIVVVRDPEGVAVAVYYMVLTLAPGESRTQGFGFTPMKAGVHSVEVYIVKSLADRTPLAEPFTATFEVK